MAGEMDLRKTIDEMDLLKKRMTRTKTIQREESGDCPTDVEGDSGRDNEKERKKESGVGLKKCLTTLDLTSLGIGSCCGTGMYVVAGMVAKDVAGPGVILSFVIAAMASLLSGVCYAEFGVRVPKTTGSAYMYSYVTVGEFIAFVIGWNLVLEYMIGTAAGAAALSACFDALSNHTISGYMTEHLGPVIGRGYPDFLAMLICAAMTVILAVGVKKSIMFSNVLNLVNLLVFIFMIVAGLFYVKTTNWSEIGFLPYGVHGVLSGAATCFYAFIGFDIIATTGEEAKEPSKSIPKAILASLIVCLTGYISVSILLTLMIPYFDIKPESALIDAFSQSNIFDGAKYIVAAGSLCALTVSLLGSLFPMPRVLYAMSKDGLLFEFLSKIQPQTGTALVSTALSGGLASITSMLVGLSTLVQMMSIGTLMAYTLVSISVLIQRYQPVITELKPKEIDEMHPGEESSDASPMEENYIEKDDAFLIPVNCDKKKYGSLPFSSEERMGRLRRNIYLIKLHLGFPDRNVLPTSESAKVVITVVCLMFCFMTAFCLLVEFGGGHLLKGEAWAVLLAVVLLLVILAGIFTLLRQPQNRYKLKFMAPGVPILPCCAMFINIYLMIKLPPITWARFGVWLLLGFFIYFLYSIRFSKKEKKSPAKGDEIQMAGNGPILQNNSAICNISNTELAIQEENQ